VVVPCSLTCNPTLYYARVRTLIGSRPDDWSRIGNFHISCTRVRTKADWRPDSDIWIAILALYMNASERESTSSGRLKQSSHKWTWKESESDRSLRGVRTGCWDVRTDTAGTISSRYNRGPDGKCTSSGRMMLGLTGVRTVRHVVRTDGTVDRWASGRDGTVFRTADRESKSSIFHVVQSLLRVLWIVESLFTASLHTQVILSRMRPKY